MTVLDFLVLVNLTKFWDEIHYCISAYRWKFLEFKEVTGVMIVVKEINWIILQIILKLIKCQVLRRKLKLKTCKWCNIMHELTWNYYSRYSNLLRFIFKTKTSISFKKRVLQRKAEKIVSFIISYCKILIMLLYKKFVFRIGIVSVSISQ